MTVRPLLNRCPAPGPARRSRRQPTAASGAARRRSAVSAVVALLTVATAGCGIRSMDVPVDDGPAPSRATCDPPDQGGGTEVFLVCDSRVESVEREVSRAVAPRDQADRIALANVLLSELQSDPPSSERAAGFSSTVPDDLRVTGALPDEREPLLRLNWHPDDLPAFALAQIICTFAQSEVFGDDEPVTLGGPDETEQPQRQYTCTASVRHQPDKLRPGDS
ncbi:hypothetical protein [Streptomyces otsuchiensis]|uniref:hypothetical protein n=1 Tax=Streptomyces otsuchiensis TaxID=2681388 RepID=UPI001030FEB9|nr:hypothetical protein [Streptomyces otsuchiensis]